MRRSMLPLLGAPVLMLALGAGPTLASVSVTLGNATPGFNDGDAIDILQLIAAQSGQPAPFDDSYGSDLFANFDQSWTFAYAPQANISSATMTFGIVDDDSASPGDQVASFQVGAVDLTSALNAVMTAGNSGDYHVYSLTLPGTAFALLAGGSATFHLVLQGPVENPVLIGGGTQTDPNNGAALIFSTLTIETRGVAPVPEPSTLALLGSGGLGLLGLVAVRRRSRPGRSAG